LPRIIILSVIWFIKTVVEIFELCEKYAPTKKQNYDNYQRKAIYKNGIFQKWDK